jgi:glycosyltransferase involved in cell wall biosynthesis
MKVLIWSQYFWPETFCINELAAALRQEGVQVSVLTGKPNYPEGKIFQGYRSAGVHREVYAGCDVVRVWLAPRHKGSRVRLALNYLSFILSGYLMAPWALRDRDYDLIFVYAPSPLLQALPALLMARIRHVPLVVWVQDLWPESLLATGAVKSRWVLKTVDLLVRYIYRGADSILVQSEAFRAPIARLATENSKKIRYFPNPTRAAVQCHGATLYEGLVSEIKKSFSVVFAGNIGIAQSMQTILSAAEILKTQQEIRFFIVGSGSREAWLRREVGRRGLGNMILGGRLPPSEMPAIFAASSALLVSLSNDNALSLTIPSKIQAYMAAGKPIIGSLDGEGARIIEAAGAGLVCPAEDAQALAAVVLELYALSPGQREGLGDNGRRYFREHFDLKLRTTELIEHFDEVIRQKNGDD